MPCAQWSDEYTPLFRIYAQELGMANPKANINGFVILILKSGGLFDIQLPLIRLTTVSAMPCAQWSDEYAPYSSTFQDSFA